jgi:hypothetical protein
LSSALRKRRRGAHREQRCDRCLAHAAHAFERFAVGAEHAGEAAEARDKRLGQRFHVTPRLRRVEQELEELVIGQSIGAAGEKALAQPLAMLEIMRLLRRGGRLGGGIGIRQGAGLGHGRGPCLAATLSKMRRRRQQRRVLQNCPFLAPMLSRSRLGVVAF